MKNTITHTAEWILLAIITALLVFTMYKSCTIKDKIETITVTDTLTIQDTITNWSYDTLYFNRYDTVKFPVVDTINDTIIKVDSIYVQIPINTYTFDTTITDSNYRTSLRAVVEGFSVSIDTLSIHTEIIKQEAILVPKQRHWGIGAGLMYGTGGFGFGVGIFYKLF